MNMKNTAILLILLLSILGLIIGVHYSEDVSSDSSAQDDWEISSEDDGGNITITLTIKNESGLDEFFT